MRHVVVSAAVILAAFTLSVAHGQQPQTLHTDIVSIAEGNYPAVTAVLNVDDATGAELSGLTAANFTATVNGKPAPVSGAHLATSQNLPLDVLIVIDVSGSMAGEPIKQAKAAASSFIASLTPADRIAIMSFADDVTVLQDYTVDRSLTQKAIDGLEAKGNTALYQATLAAVFKAATSTSSRRAVILLSDGAQDGVPSTVTRDDAINAAAGIGVPFFAIAEGKGIDRAYLQQLATSTKGRELEAPKPGDLTALYASVSRLLRSQYIVTFDASAASGTSEAPLAITLQADTRTATATGTFKPGPAFAVITATISGLQAGEALDAARAITVSTPGGGEISRVAFSVDGVNVFESSSAPYSFTYEPESFSEGAHTLTVLVQAGSRSVAAPPIAFSSTPPAVVVSSGGSSLPIAPIAAGTVAVLLAAGVVIVLRRRPPREHVVPPEQRVTPWAVQHRSLSEVPSSPAVEEAPVPTEQVLAPVGVLISRSGADLGSEYAVGSAPVSVGSGSQCAVRIADSDLGAVEARIWVRKGHLMVHKMTRLSSIANDGPPGGWVILESGDTFDVGPHTFEFRLLEAHATLAPSDIPNVLREADIPRRKDDTAAAPARSPRMTDLMSQPDRGFAPETGEQAS